MNCINDFFCFNDLNAQVIEKEKKAMRLLITATTLTRQDFETAIPLTFSFTPLTGNNSTLAAKTFFIRYIILFLNLKVL